MWKTRVRSGPGRRLAYGAGYLLMAVAGVFANIWPSQTVTNAAESERYLVVIWGIFLFGGGLCSALGAFTERWLGEYLGLPLLSAVFSVYAVSSFATGRQTSYPAATAFAAVAALFLGRWLDVAEAKKIAKAAADLTRHSTVKPDRLGEPDG